MSGAGGEGRLSPNSDIEISAADWISRQQFDTWNDAECAKLDAWLAEADNHAAAYWRLKATWDRTNRLAALRFSAPMRATPTIDKRPLKSIFKVIATLIIFAVVSGTGAYFYLLPRGETFSTVVGGHSTITLVDGSQIDLNTNTTIRADVDAHRRIVNLLKGEAYFQIKHDGARPFIVKVANHRITDLGTKFLIRTSSRNLEVALVEGSARIERADGTTQRESALLTPGDIVVATADSMHISKKSARDLANGLAWRRGVLVFHNSSLADAAAEFNRYGDTKLIVSDTDTAKLTVNGTFRTNGGEEFAGVAHEIFGVRVQTRGGNIILSR